MKFRSLIVVALAVLVAVGCNQGIQEKTKFETVRDSASYAIGWSFGMQMKGQMMDPDINAVYAGIKDALVDQDTLIDLQKLGMAIQKFQMESRKKAEEKAKVEAEANKKEGEAFLTENAKKEGVKVLESGIQYKVLEEGKGKKPAADSKVQVHYIGRLLSGKVFDSSVQRNTPFEFSLTGGVIDGWLEVGKLMREGDKWEVYIPSNLAYGDRGTPGGPIPPGATLIFEISFLKVLDK